MQGYWKGDWEPALIIYHMEPNKKIKKRTRKQKKMISTEDPVPVRDEGR